MTGAEYGVGWGMLRTSHNESHTGTKYHTVTNEVGTVDAGTLLGDVV